jgi:hypothetical protein
MARSSGVIEGRAPGSCCIAGASTGPPKREATLRDAMTKARTVMLVPHAGLNAAARQVSSWPINQLPALGIALVNPRGSAGQEAGLIAHTPCGYEQMLVPKEPETAPLCPQCGDAMRLARKLPPVRPLSGLVVHLCGRCAFRRSRPGIPREGGRLYRLKPARDSDDPGRLAGQALVSTSSSGQLAGSSSSF